MQFPAGDLCAATVFAVFVTAPRTIAASAICVLYMQQVLLRLFLKLQLMPWQGTTLRSVRHALGPSFGSLALGSAILTAVQIARQIVEVCAPT